jgi:hypothetical protein
MSAAYCLLNHQLTENQIAELASDFGVETIVYPPEALSAMWSNVPTEKSLPPSWFAPFTRWLSTAEQGNLAIIQGEFGAVFALTDYALRHGLITVHAVTRRVSREIREGEVIRKNYVFEHVCFRPYRYYRDL